MLNGFIQRISSGLLKPSSASCRVVHDELVELKLGDRVFTMNHESALLLSQKLRVVGKQARRQSGEKGRWHATAVLTDAENDYKRGW